MKIKTEKQQLREMIARVDELTNWQHRKVGIAKKRLRIKEDYIISFWITSSPNALRYTLEIEQDILSSLIEYEKILSEKLIKCD